MKTNIFTKVALAALAVAAGTTAAHAQSAPAPSHSTSWTGTVGEDRFGDARFKVRGRFQYDLSSVEWDNDSDDGFHSYTRRAFLGVQGRFSEQWRYKVDFVLSPGNNSDEQVGVDDAFLEYVGDNWSIVLGEANVTSPLEDRISSLDIPFVERSGIINAFGYCRLAGIGFLTGGANWSLSAAAQGDSLNDAENFNTGESTAISGRFTFAPIFSTTPEGTTLLHLGVHGRMRDSGEGGDYRYRVRPQNGRSDRWIESQNAAINSGDSDTTYGVEAAVQFGPFVAQAEYMWLDGENAAGAGFDADGYYVDVYWSLTGESRNYRGNQGSFGSITPRNPVTSGGMGHWMLSARYDAIDLSDIQFGATRGEQTAWAVGLDWVPLDHVRFKLNYADSEMERTAGADTNAQIVTLRTQFDF
jgi:phosphate-selective porin OprO/OprP